PECSGWLPEPRRSAVSRDGDLDPPYRQRRIRPGPLGDTMAKQNGLGDRCFVSGVDVSGDVSSLSSIHGGIATLDVTDITKSARERIGGMRDGSMAFSSFFNDSAAQAHKTLRTLPTADVLVSYLRGTAIGSPMATLAAK